MKSPLQWYHDIYSSTYRAEYGPDRGRVVARYHWSDLTEVKAMVWGPDANEDATEVRVWADDCNLQVARDWVEERVRLLNKVP